MCNHCKENVDKNTTSAKWLCKAIHYPSKVGGNNCTIMFYIANQQIMDMENLGEGLHNQEILDGIVFRSKEHHFWNPQRSVNSAQSLPK